LDRLPADVRAQLERDADARLLGRVQLPEDAGQFVIEDRSVAWAYRIARYGNDIVYATIGVTVACYALAIGVARDRRATLRTSGVVMAMAGVVSLALLLPVGYAARSFAENKDAASSVVDILTESYRTQSLILIVTGIAVAVVAALFGNSGLSVAIRSMLRGSPEAPSLQEVIRPRVGALRVVGLVAAAVVLIAWPEPTTRVYATTLLLLAVYMLALYVAVSDAAVAVRARERMAAATSAGRQRSGRPADEQGNGSGAIRSWVRVHATLLRIAGVCALAALIVAWPELSVRFLVMVAALGLIYLAAIDLAAADDDARIGQHGGQS
jgi:hypothetical protein